MNDTIKFASVGQGILQREGHAWVRAWEVNRGFQKMGVRVRVLEEGHFGEHVYKGTKKLGHKGANFSSFQPGRVSLRNCREVK